MKRLFYIHSIQLTFLRYFQQSIIRTDDIMNNDSLPGGLMRCERPERG